MKINKEKTVAVNVATLWTSANSPRDIDQPATQRPADLPKWIGEMNHQQLLGLHEDNLVQSQLLFGTNVFVAEEKDDWNYVLVPSQTTHKSEIGYPGWIPANQLSEAVDPAEVYLTVTADKTQLETEETSLTLSYLTKLPVVAETDTYFVVHTPLGEGRISKKDAEITDPKGKNGETIVRTGERFLGLPYLWGGMSSFGYDCSGFAYNMHLAAGWTIPRDASDQAKGGKEISFSAMERGDLLFFAYENGTGKVHHVGIYYGGGKLLHSPKTGKAIEIIDLKDTVYEKELCAVRRYWQ